MIYEPLMTLWRVSLDDAHKIVKPRLFLCKNL